MGRIKQQELAKKATIEKHLNVSPNGTLTIEAGFVYYENSSSEFSQVVITDEYDNIQPVMLSTTSDYTEIKSFQPALPISDIDIRTF
jgi:hypothetical protein|tara:strand:- start:306 stop:566 length:261 start_codon:yes stop_codon:yes gene_type:complete